MISRTTYLSFLFFTFGASFIWAISPFLADPKLHPDMYEKRLLELLNAGFFLLPMVSILVMGILYVVRFDNMKASDLSIIGLHVMAAPLLTSVMFALALAPATFGALESVQAIVAGGLLGTAFYLRHRRLHNPV